MTQTGEIAFEHCLEEVFLNSGYLSIAPQSFDRERAFFPAITAAFIRETQATVWEKLEALHGTKTEERVLHDLCQ